MDSEIKKLLLSLCTKKDQVILKALYMLCYDRFFRTAFYFVKSDDAAEEIVQDLFIRIWESPDTFGKLDQPLNYFFTILKHESLRYLKRRSTQTFQTELIEEQLFYTEETPENTLISEELFQQYLNILGKLPPRCREVFIRIREEKQSYEEVAESMHISVHTVSAQLQKAIALFKELL